MTTELIKIGSKYYIAEQVQKVLDSRIEEQVVTDDKNMLLDLLKSVSDRIDTAIANELSHEDLDLEKQEIINKINLL